MPAKSLSQHHAAVATNYTVHTMYSGLGALVLDKRLMQIKLVQEVERSPLELLPERTSHGVLQQAQQQNHQQQKMHASANQQAAVQQVCTKLASMSLSEHSTEHHTPRSVSKPCDLHNP